MRADVLGEFGVMISPIITTPDRVPAGCLQVTDIEVHVDDVCTAVIPAVAQVHQLLRQHLRPTV